MKDDIIKLRQEFEKRTIKAGMEVASVGHQMANEAKRKAFNEAIELLDKYIDVESYTSAIDVLNEAINLLKAENEMLKDRGGFSRGGRDMMRIIISMLEGKVDSNKHNTDKCLVKDLDYHMGRTSAFKEILEIIKRDLNMLEHGKAQLIHE